MDKRTEYIGDGIHASFDGYYIKLETSCNQIFLEDTVFAALVEYGRKCFNVDAEPEQVTP